MAVRSRYDTGTLDDMNVKGLIALFVLVPVLSQASDELASVLEASIGTWEGELYYLDYQSGERFGIPMRVEAEVTPDGTTLVRRLTFTDPGNLVHAVNLVTVDRESGELIEAYFRQGSAELLRFEMTDVTFEDARQWKIVYEQDGRDDDKPARIRHTIERRGDRLESTKEVQFPGEKNEFFFRNGTRLTLVEAD